VRRPPSSAQQEDGSSEVFQELRTVLSFSFSETRLPVKKLLPENRKDTVKEQNDFGIEGEYRYNYPQSEGLVLFSFFGSIEVYSRFP
jgi:hypothetical protein